MPGHPTVEELFEKLRRAGWQASEKGVVGGWRVFGTRESITLHTEGVSREEAWRRAWEQAQAVVPTASLPRTGQLATNQHLRKGVRLAVLAGYVGGAVGALAGWLAAPLLMPRGLESAFFTQMMRFMLAVWGVTPGLLLGLWIGCWMYDNPRRAAESDRATRP